MKLLVINNQDSGLSNKSVFSYMRQVSQFADEITVRSCCRSWDPSAFLYDADEFDAVICAGGDGTFAALSHMMAYTGIPILPYPAGTANLMALNLFLPTDDPALAKITYQMKTLDFDLGELTLSNGTKKGFAIMAGAGYDATIMQEAIPGKKILGPLSYATAALTNFAPQHADIMLNVDGKEITTSGVGVLLINFSRIQFDLSVVHDNNPVDGMFDVVVFNTSDAIGLIPALWAAILDKSGDFPSRSGAFQVFSGKHVEVVTDPPLQIQFDGEPSKLTTPFSADILPKAARIIVGSDAIKNFSEY
ncbi:diacylglycerol/lipid kinase family protein [Phoenicibacter congonensis]|uniref:diacylglycerol/lipid kinase family protein n=1 Tax=Phoenicibacter congonensis TaxID=1944646 RepID=UPI0009A7AF6B|nr:diacylglycerol kinase family protein [Phoenicibacter congonensis]